MDEQIELRYRPRLYQLADRIALLHEIFWAAGGIEELSRAHVDAEVVVQRGEDLLHVDRAVLGVPCIGGCRADRLTGRHAAAGQKGPHHLGPMVAPGAIIHARRAAELAPQ